MEPKVEAIAFHRNGVMGAPFHVVLFHDDSPKLGIVFDATHHCAVLDREKLARCDIEFGSNSWRGDVYEDELRDVIRDAAAYERGGDE
jgi:hypothetical protein